MVRKTVDDRGLWIKAELPFLVNTERPKGGGERILVGGGTGYDHGEIVVRFDGKRAAPGDGSERSEVA
ncbi:MAG: hypothetical protein KAJ06_09875 [Gammaproteobacteria bacterium]|nr:hypothetical protein [Gammaproteobacteria bacterium]